jgi:hypothetical protein
MSRRVKEHHRLIAIYFHREGSADEYKVNEKGRLATRIASKSRRPLTPLRRIPMVAQPPAQAQQPESGVETIIVLDIEEFEPDRTNFQDSEPWNDFDLLLTPERAPCCAEKQEFPLDDSVGE